MWEYIIGIVIAMVTGVVWQLISEQQPKDAYKSEGKGKSFKTLKRVFIFIALVILTYFIIAVLTVIFAK